MEDLKAGALHGFFDDKLCAVMILNTDQNPEYSGVEWRFRENPVSVHLYRE